MGKKGREDQIGGGLGGHQVRADASHVDCYIRSDLQRVNRFSGFFKHIVSHNALHMHKNDPNSQKISSESLKHHLM